MQVNDSYITVEGLKIYAYHGVLPIERKVGNMFEVSVELHYDAQSAMRNDNIDTALNYANVVAEIVRVMGKPRQLLEHVAYEIVERLNAHFSIITCGKITVTKIKPPIAEEMDSVSFTFEWTR